MAQRGSKRTTEKEQQQKEEMESKQGGTAVKERI
jgi:hypothetical protein